MHAIQAAPRVAPSAGLQGHWSGADAAARTPAAAPTPAAAALAVAAATGAQGRRRALRELDAAVDGHTAPPTLGHRLAPLFAGVHVGWCARTGSAAAATTSARRPRAHLAARGARETHSPACEVKSGTRAVSARGQLLKEGGVGAQG